jgi:hypothetical protein
MIGGNPAGIVCPTASCDLEALCCTTAPTTTCKAGFVDQGMNWTGPCAVEAGTNSPRNTHPGHLIVTVYVKFLSVVTHAAF